MAEVTLPLHLIGHEVAFLSDVLRTGSTVKEREDELDELRPLILLIAGLYDELVFMDRTLEHEVVVAVSEKQVWLMRTKVRSADVALDNKTNIGIWLTRKLHSLLLRFASEVDIVTVDAPDLSYKEYLDAKQISSQDTNSGPGDNAG